MRIKKIFELVEYEEVDRWRPLGRYWSTRQISSEDRERLCEILPQLRKPYEHEKGYINKGKIIYGRGSDRIDIDILVDDDEWFFVRIVKGDLIYGKQKYYKCDQFEGLVKLIKDIISKF